MANVVNCENVRVLVSDRVLLDGVSLGIADGDAIGVVGRNGDGKSTLLKLLAGVRAPDSGRVSRRGGVSLAMLTQRDTDGSRTVSDLVLGDLAGHEWAGERRVREVLAGLLGGLDGRDVGGLDAPMSRLSGGQRRRVALAAVLIADPDLLLLDEPTNHLDVDGVAWLAEHLRTRSQRATGAMAIVTHDRWFLDAVCTTTWEVHDASVDAYDGGYAAWVLARAERSRVAATTEERRQNLLRKELAWLQRGAPARTSKPRFRIDAATALVADEPAPRDTLALQRLATARLGKDVIDLEGVTVRVDTPTGPRTLLQDITWRLAPGERVGVVGPNGAGKTTLLRLLTGAHLPDSGRVRSGKTVRSAMLTQDVAELDAVSHRRAVEAVADVAGVVEIGGRDVTAAQLVEQLGFPKERAWTPVATLSGGERRRLQLLRLLLGGPNVLLLDEPTNDLDTDALAAMEDVLDGWAGTLVVVSHDRYLLERLCDRQVGVFGDGRVRDLPGGVDEYLAIRRREAAVTVGSGAPPAPTSKPTSRRASEATVDAAVVRAARKDAARLERQIAKFEADITRLHHELASNATDAAAVLILDTDLRAAITARDRHEEEWLQAMEVAEG